VFPSRYLADGARSPELGAQAPRERPRNQSSQAQSRAEQPPPGQPFAQQPSQDTLTPGPGDALVNNCAADIYEVSVFDTGGAGRLAAPAGQTSIQMNLCSASRLGSLEDLFDLIDAASRTVELIPE